MHHNAMLVSHLYAVMNTSRKNKRITSHLTNLLNMVQAIYDIHSCYFFYLAPLDSYFIIRCVQNRRHAFHDYLIMWHLVYFPTMFLLFHLVCQFHVGCTSRNKSHVPQISPVIRKKPKMAHGIIFCDYACG